MPSINLAQGTQYVVAARKRRVRVFAIAGVIAIIFAVVATGMFAYSQQLNNRKTNLGNQIRNVELKIAVISADAKRVDMFENRLRNLDVLIDNHISMEPILQDIERLLPPGTTLKELKINVENATVSIDGTTTDVDQVAQAIASLINSDTHETVFTSSEFKSIQRSETTNEEEIVAVEYTFRLVLTFDPSILKTTE